jgi:hypothetical protein
MNERLLLVLVGLPYLAMLLAALVEVVRRRDLPVGRRVVWFAALLVVPVVALFAYVVARPPRSVRISGSDGDPSPAEAIVLLAERRQRGELSDTDYAAGIDQIATLD